MNFDPTILIWVAAFGLIIYFLMIRPNKKRQDEQRKMMDAMTPGARVMLTSGIFGTLQAVGEKQMVVELAPGVAITVVKQAIMKVVPAEEEEFEYTDEDVIEPAEEPLQVTDGTPDEPDNSGDEPALEDDKQSEHE